MNARVSTIFLTLAIVLGIVTSGIFEPLALSQGVSKGTLDLFTHQEPFSGRGANVPSDAFGPENIVILYAFVTYNGIPVPNVIVTYQVTEPGNMTFTMTSNTNESGIAAIQFAIPSPSNGNESLIFGQWQVLASALVQSLTLSDKMNFRVDWVIKLITLRTISQKLSYSASFGRNGDVGIELTLRSISFRMRNANIALAVLDVEGVPINSVSVPDFDVPPNETVCTVFFKLNIPNDALVGNATITASALTAPLELNGVAYCPSISAGFMITGNGAVSLSFHDAAILAISTSATFVPMGQTFSATVLVRNEGTELETFMIDVYFGNDFLGTQQLVEAPPFFEQNVTFTVNTSSLEVGSYEMNASIPMIPNEADTSDNTLVNGFVQLTPPGPPYVHDVAISNVTSSSNQIYAGEVVSVNVTSVNVGTSPETFTVTAYYGNILMATLQVDLLDPGANQIISFPWNTSLVQTDFYQISAVAYLATDMNLLDNTYVDGVIQILPGPPPVHDIAVTQVTTSVGLAYIGTTVDANVTVKNNGNYSETFRLYLRYNQTSLASINVADLGPGASKVVTFHWNTNGVSQGNYTLSAFAEPVSGETKTDDNTLVDGTVELLVAPGTFFLPYWFNWFLILLILALVMLISAYVYVRRRNSRGEQQAFYSGWTAWYYNYTFRDGHREKKRSRKTSRRLSPNSSRL